jgi:hypothetical protein
MTDMILRILLVACLAAIWFAWNRHEQFVDELDKISTRALDAAPNTVQAKMHYRNLLIYIDDNLRKQGVSGISIISDFGKRVYGREMVREDIDTDTPLKNWPKWLAPLSTTDKDPVLNDSDAASAEQQLLAYLNLNFPNGSKVDVETGEFVRHLTQDVGERFFFKKGETVKVRDDLLTTSLVKGWSDPSKKIPALPVGYNKGGQNSLIK